MKPKGRVTPATRGQFGAAGPLAPVTLADHIDPRVRRQWNEDWERTRGPIFHRPGAPPPELIAVPPGEGFAYADQGGNRVYLSPNAQRMAIHNPRAFQFLEGHEQGHAVLNIGSEGRANHIGNRVMRLLRPKGRQ